MRAIVLVAAVLCTQAVADRWSARWRHAVARLHSGAVFVLGGHDGAFRNDVWRSDDGGSTWATVPQIGLRWSPRWGHSAMTVANGSSIAVLGGDAGGHLHADVWVASVGPVGSSWTRIEPQGPTWTPRWGHTTLLHRNGSLVVMGGYDGTYLDDVWLSDLAFAVWSRVAPAGPRWPPRWGHAAIVLRNSSDFLVLGGFDGARHLNDVWRSADAGAVWTRVDDSSGPIWTPRREHACAALPNGTIIVAGGWSSEIQADSWVSHTDGATWRSVIPVRHLQIARRWGEYALGSSTLRYNAKDMFPTTAPYFITDPRLTADADKYRGAVLGDDGKIYCIPSSANSVMVIDPETDTVDFIPGVVRAGYLGGVLAPNGNIYAAPSVAHNGAVLVVSTLDRSVRYIGEGNFSVGTVNQWWGGVLGLDGKIYFAPQGQPGLLVIDVRGPVEAVYVVSIPGFGGIGQYAGAVLGPNGKIHLVPMNAPSIKTFEPLDGSFSDIALTPGSQQYTGGVLGPGGKIFLVPRSAASVAIVDPIQGTADQTTLVGFSTGSAQWFGGTLGRDGRVYFIPFNGESILVVDTNVSPPAWREIAVDVGTAKWLGGVLAPNGKIYAVPCNHNKVMVIRTGTPMLPHWMLEPEFNKF